MNNVENNENPLAREIRVSIGWADNFIRFKPVTMPFNHLVKVVTDPSKAYSFSWYKDSYRLMKNVIPGVDVVALDFDSCEKVEKIIEEKFDKYYGFISPTKSHMKCKGGLTLPRYRVIFLLKETCFLETMNYSQAYANMIEDLGLGCQDYCGKQCNEKQYFACDTAVKDPARLFYGASVDPTLIRPLKGGEYLDFMQFDYKKEYFATELDYIVHSKIDISKYKDIEIDNYLNLDPSKRYECPICAMYGEDPNKHHLGVSNDGKYVTCFFDNEHSHILRKLKYLDELPDDYKTGKEENSMPKIAATPSLFKFKIQDPHPNNVDIVKVQKSFDKSLEYFKDHKDLICLDIETYTQEAPEYTREEAKEVYKKEYSGIPGAYDAAFWSHKCNGFDNYYIKTRLISLTHKEIDPGNPNPRKMSIPFDTCITTPDQLSGIFEILRTCGMCGGHNLKFDLLTLAYNYGIDNIMPPVLFDTMLGARIDQMARDVEMVPAGNGLGACLWRYCNIAVDKEVEHSWGNDNLSLIQLHYSINDTLHLPDLINAEIRSIKEALGTFEYTNHPRKELEFLGPLLNIHPVVALEMQFLRELVRIEYNGVMPDLKMLRTKAEKFYKFYYETQDKVGVNLNSPIQLKKWLQQNVDPNITTTSGKILSPIYSGDAKFDEIMKARTQYKRAVLMDAMTAVKDDDRLHPQFTQLLNTGRQACKNPNMQQIPGDIKHSVYATRGHDWYYAHNDEYRAKYDEAQELERQIKELEAQEITV